MRSSQARACSSGSGPPRWSPRACCGGGRRPPSRTASLCRGRPPAGAKTTHSAAPAPPGPPCCVRATSSWMPTLRHNSGRSDDVTLHPNQKHTKHSDARRRQGCERGRPAPLWWRRCGVWARGRWTAMWRLGPPPCGCAALASAVGSLVRSRRACAWRRPTQTRGCGRPRAASATLSSARSSRRATPLRPNTTRAAAWCVSLPAATA